MAGMLFNSCLKLPSILRNGNAEKLLNDQIIMPPGSFQVDDSDLITTNDLNVLSSGSGYTGVNPGESFVASISFEGDVSVTHAGMRFGNSGKTWIIPINKSANKNSGTANISMTIPSGLCDDLSDICHDIKCYEFAVRESGGGSYQISRANINDLAMMCGNCDEPSCQELLDDCYTGSAGVGGCSDLYPDDCGNMVGFCCDDDLNCYYTYRGSNYYCNSDVDCYEAAEDLVNDMLDNGCKSADFTVEDIRKSLN